MVPRTQCRGEENSFSRRPSKQPPPGPGRPGRFRIFHLAAPAGWEPHQEPALQGPLSRPAPTDAAGTLLLPRSSGPRVPRNAPGKFRRGLTRAEGWGPFFCLQRPFFVPLSPGSKGQPLQGHSHQSRAWAENLRLFID